MVLQTPRLTIQEFIQRYSDEGSFEYRDGKIIPLIPQVAGAGMVKGLLYHSLETQITMHKMGAAFIELSFVILGDEPDVIVRTYQPDVLFVQQERLTQMIAKYPNWLELPLMIVPDFVAEVVSPTDKFSDVLEKVKRYLEDGVLLVWVLEPHQKSIIVYRAGSNQSTTYSVADTISTADIIPGFELKLSDLYAD